MDLPDSNPKTRLGVAKPGVHAIPVSAILHLGQAMEDGRRKYGLANWRTDKISASVYYNAAMRHLMKWWDGQDTDPESLCAELSHVMACCAIVLDAAETGQLLDDRPLPGPLPTLVARLTKSAKP